MAKSFITSSDLDNERDNTGTVHDGTDDHPGAGTLASGYTYGGISSLYSSLYGSNLVGWWPLHEQSGQANDLSGSDNHGTVTGATQGVGGRGGLTAYSFDGTDDYIDLSSNFSTFSTYTISTWAYFNGVNDGGNNHYVVRLGANNNILIYTDGSGNIVLQQRDSGDTYQNVSTAISNNAWYHVVGVWDGSTLELYLDSVSEGTVSIGSMDTNQGLQDQIGANGAGGSNMDGTLTGFRIYDRVLSDAEIQTLYEWGSGDYAVPPDNNDGGVSYYDFNSANANDQWGSNDGTVSGATHVASGGPRGDGAYSFDGTDDYIDTGISSLTAPLTLSGWVNLDETNSESLVGNWSSTANDLHIRSSAGGFDVLDDDAGHINPSSPAATTGDWYHLVYALDSTQGVLYINAVQAGTNGGGSATYNNGSTFKIGAPGDLSTDLWMNGTIDDVRIYNRALEPWEVQELYQYGALGIDGRKHTVNAI